MYTKFPAVPWKTLIPETSNSEFAGKWDKLREIVWRMVMFEPGYRMEPDAAMEMLEMAGVKGYGG